MTRLNIPLFVALAASILSAVPVDARDTLPHQRMIRKRGPAPMEPIAAAVVVGLHARQLLDTSSSSAAAATPTTTSEAAAATSEAASTSRAATTTAAAATTSTTAAAATTSSSSSSAAAATTSSGGLLDGLTSALLATSTSSSSTTSEAASTSTTPTSTSAVTPTSTSTSAVAPQTSATSEQQQQQQPSTTDSPTLNIATSAPTSTAKGAQTSVAFVTSTIAAAAEASASAAAKAKTAKITRNTIISLVVVASCIGGAIAIWTVIRKWKLSPSEKFDDRMQPIDWAPPPAAGVHDDAIEEKTKHRRAGSGASHGSFTSGGVGQSEAGHGAKYNDSQQGHGYQDFPPPHDFTAGTAQPGYGQYYGAQQFAGGAGYADLQRGASMSESTYSHGASVQRGLSYSRGPGGYEAQPGAAAPPLPNPYGGEYGYEDYGHQPAGQQQQQQAQGQAPYRAAY